MCLPDIHAFLNTFLMYTFCGVVREGLCVCFNITGLIGSPGDLAMCVEDLLHFF